MSIVLTKESLIEAIEAAVEEKGADYVYPFTYTQDEYGHEEKDSCRYVVNGEPACLIGNALVRVGVPVSAFDGLEGYSALAVIKELHARRVIDFVGDSDDIRFATIAQVEQDGGKSWGTALEVARVETGLVLA